MYACEDIQEKASFGVRRHVLTVRSSSASGAACCMFGREVALQSRWQRLGQICLRANASSSKDGPC